MRVECPSCETSYDVADSAIGPKGRKLRCGKCSLVWHISLPEPEPEPVRKPEPVPEQEQTQAVDFAEKDDLSAFEEEFSEPETDQEDEDSMAAAFEELNEDMEEADIDVDSEDFDTGGGDLDILAGLDADSFASEGIRKVSDGDDKMGGLGSDRDKESLATIEANVASALAEANEVRSIEAEAARGNRNNGKSSGALSKGGRLHKMLGVASLAASIMVIVAAVALRAPIVRAVPDLASLYSAIGLEVNLRGLAFRDIRMLREVSNGSPVFVVEGLIQNISRKTVRLPEVLFSLRDDAKSEIFSWTTTLSLTALPPGEVTRFKTELTTAPAIATDVLVRFNDSPQRRAGL